MKAKWNGVVIADSDKTILIEGNHYFPPGSVQTEYLAPSAATAVCPWKGLAHYYHVVVGNKEIRDAAWYYPNPKEAALEITDHVAFGDQISVVDE